MSVVRTEIVRRPDHKSIIQPDDEEIQLKLRIQVHEEVETVMM